MATCRVPLRYEPSSRMPIDYNIYSHMSTLWGVIADDRLAFDWFSFSHSSDPQNVAQDLNAKLLFTMNRLTTAIIQRKPRKYNKYVSSG